MLQLRNALGLKSANIVLAVGKSIKLDLNDSSPWIGSVKNLAGIKPR